MVSYFLLVFLTVQGFEDQAPPSYTDTVLLAHFVDRTDVFFPREDNLSGWKIALAVIFPVLAVLLAIGFGVCVFIYYKRKKSKAKATAKQNKR